MQTVLAAALVALGAVAVPQSAALARAEPYDCPPACDRIPDSAWVTPAAIPLHGQYGWPQLAGLASPAAPGRFRFEELCGTPPPQVAPPAPPDPRGYAVTARSVVVNPPGQWQLEAQILHWRGETWRGGQITRDVFTEAADALRNCQRTNLLASPSLTVEEPDRMAAVVSGPVVLHEYLLANPSNNTISELALWSFAPPLTAWPAVADDAVLDAMSASLCTAYIGSCR